MRRGRGRVACRDDAGYPHGPMGDRESDGNRLPRGGECGAHARQEKRDCKHEGDRDETRSTTPRRSRPGRAEELLGFEDSAESISWASQGCAGLQAFNPRPNSRTPAMLLVKLGGAVITVKSKCGARR